ncbi:MAG: PorV/PorQ family protein, partial [Candidatus Cloacimonetes bacterium]|nr:PorV/PorQ family protein [Candidatus Cloacimonadota bacterium]
MHFFSQKIIKLFILAILLVSPILVYGISQAACLFLLIEQGSRAGAMGQAYVAQVDDGFAGWWNPGAMAFNRSNQLALMHSNWLGDVPGIDDMYIEYISWNNYNEALLGNLGFHIIFLTYGEQERVNEQGQPLGTFSSFEVAFAGTYAYQYSDNLGMGLTFKIIYSDLAPSGAPGNVQDVKGRGISFAFDFGAKQKNLGLSGLDA